MKGAPVYPPKAGSKTAQAKSPAVVEVSKNNREKKNLASFVRKTKVSPLDPVSWVTLAKHEHAAGLIDDAINHLQRAFSLCPGRLDVCSLLAELLCDKHNYVEAIRVLDRLSEKTEKNHLWYLNKARAQAGSLDFDEAVHNYYEAARLAPENKKLQVAAFSGMGACFMKMGMHSEAAICFRSLLNWNCFDIGAAISAAHASSWACDWAGLQMDFSRLAECLEICSSDEKKSFLYSINSFPMITLTDDPSVQRWTSKMTAKNYLSGCSVVPWSGDLHVKRFDGRIKIGFVSSDFHFHATMMLAIEFFEEIDKNLFELHIYSGGPVDDSVLRNRLKLVASGWRETSSMSDEQLVDMIRNDGIGVLVDMKGYTLGSRISVFAYRPAPIQISWLGYPGTTGASCIDYFVGDKVVSPTSDQDDFSECIAQMPFCYQPNDSRRGIGSGCGRGDFSLPDGKFVFASFNQQYKIVPEIFEAWCNILLSVPESVLWLLVRHDESKSNLKKFAADHGISPDRIIFAPFVGMEQHRRRLPLADLCLDTFPCGGHTTASDALWAGVPVLALTGRSFASRVASSLLYTLELPELVCSDIDQYIAAAIRLATEPGACADVRQRLARARVESPLFDGRRYARDFERLLLRMVERQDAGLPPAPLAAELS